MEKQNRIIDLDRIAMAVIHGEVESETVWSLCYLDQLTVLSLINIYSICLNGFMSRKTCKKMKLKIFKEHDLLKSRLGWDEVHYQENIEMTRKLSSKKCEVSKALQNGEFWAALESALECLDAMHSGNVYMQLFEEACRDKKTKAKALNVAKSKIDELYAKYGNDVPYAKMIESFYAAADRDDITEVFKYLNPDKYEPLCEIMEVKTDDEKVKKEIAARIYNLYDYDPQRKYEK